MVMNGGSVVEIDLGGAFMEDSFGDPFFGTTTRYVTVRRSLLLLPQRQLLQRDQHPGLLASTSSTASAPAATLRERSPHRPELRASSRPETSHAAESASHGERPEDDVAHRLKKLQLHLLRSSWRTCCACGRAPCP